MNRRDAGLAVAAVAALCWLAFVTRHPGIGLTLTVIAAATAVRLDAHRLGKRRDPLLSWFPARPAQTPDPAPTDDQTGHR